ncbi:MAG TPA: glycerol-3-phosphate 1-O-acyltransferase PlsY [Pyrinomonadaceae bacterium]|nr:glycerol-3-phosphate 1-O-acyltransferase PlsY [Pyrinomonadaceae bacterium]
MLPVLLVLAAYLLGSIPFGYLIVRSTGGGDVRETGSGGTGATNVTRRVGKWAGILTLALDAIKGVVAVTLARRLLTDDFGFDWWVGAAAVAVILGHMFPVWLSFRGGKGVATGLGVFLSLSPLAVAVAMALFVVIVWMTRYVSLGSIIATAVLPLCIWLLSLRDASITNLAPLLTTAITASALIILMHRANIGRLWRGTENKLK